MLDIMSWNVNGARLAQVMHNIERRVHVIALQEVRTPRASSWASMCGHVEGAGDGGERRRHGDPHGLLKKYKLKVIEARRDYMLVKLQDGERVRAGLHLHSAGGQPLLQR